jgi:hypothetical protein
MDDIEDMAASRSRVSDEEQDIGQYNVEAKSSAEHVIIEKTFPNAHNQAKSQAKKKSVHLLVRQPSSCSSLVQILQTISVGPN